MCTVKSNLQIFHSQDLTFNELFAIIFQAHACTVGAHTHQKQYSAYSKIMHCEFIKCHFYLYSEIRNHLSCLNNSELLNCVTNCRMHILLFFTLTLSLRLLQCSHVIVASFTRVPFLSARIFLNHF